MDVLLVEDDELIREVLGADLSEAGLSVVATPTAEEALRAAGDEAQPPAVLVTDVNLGPGMDGLTLAAQARRRWPSLGVVVMTGDPRNLIHHPDVARERVLLKPFVPERLLAEVNTLLGAPAG